MMHDARSRISLQTLSLMRPGTSQIVYETRNWFFFFPLLLLLIYLIIFRCLLFAMSDGLRRGLLWLLVCIHHKPRIRNFQVSLLDSFVAQNL